MLKSAVIEEKNFKHNLWAWTDIPLGPKFLCQQKVSSLLSFVAFLKRISSTSDFIKPFHDLINVCSRRSGAHNPRGQSFEFNRNLLSLRSFATSFKKISLTNFLCQQKHLLSMVICCKFQNNLFEVRFYDVYDDYMFFFR